MSYDFFCLIRIDFVNYAAKVYVKKLSSYLKGLDNGL